MGRGILISVEMSASRSHVEECLVRPLPHDERLAEGLSRLVVTPAVRETGVAKHATRQDAVGDQVGTLKPAA